MLLFFLVAIYSFFFLCNLFVAVDTSGKCDLFNGEWIPNPFGAAYTSSCRFIAHNQNCIRSGRSNTSYINWRWKPQDCDVPLFDPDKFLSAMRNKVWAFVGDSIFRNFAESFICLLSKVSSLTVTHCDGTN